MIKEKFEPRMVEEKVVVERKLFCDKCGKEIKPGHYFKVTTGHEEWGNDSIDSIEDHDYCSYLCLEEALSDYLFKDDYGKNSSSAFFEIRRKYFIGIENEKMVYKWEVK